MGRVALWQTDDGAIEMRISSVHRSDTGLYVCRIINEYGTKQAECTSEVSSGGLDGLFHLDLPPWGNPVCLQVQERQC